MRQAVAVLAPALLLFAPLAGCQRVEQLYDSKLTTDTPVDWWHQLEGGAIAEDRPPPPGVSAPYPNLDQVPGQTPAVNAAAQRTLETQLLAERDEVRRNVVQDPLSASPPNQPAAPPPLPGDPDASHVVADAASATPVPGPAAATALAPHAAPAAAPVAAASAAPSSPAPTRASSKAPARTTPAAAASASAPAPGPPAVPEAPPPLPQLAGIDASLVPAASRPPPPGVAISFRRGSAELPLSAVGALQALAARRAGGPIAISAGGDSGPSPAAQAAALPLALRRADVVRTVLVAGGVPPGDVRATAVAAARGTRADLIQSP